MHVAWAAAGATRSTVTALHQLSNNDGARRPLAADILQEALDSALRTVFRFSEALGQRTIEEIVDDIRRSLLADGKELVLLIEDFAALAGIQQPLLNLMIAESDQGHIQNVKSNYTATHSLEEAKAAAAGEEKA